MKNLFWFSFGCCIAAAVLFLTGCAGTNEQRFAGDAWFQEIACPDGSVSTHCPLPLRKGPIPWNSGSR